MQTYLFSEPFLNFKLSLPKDFCEKKNIYIYRVFQRFVPIVNCILRKAFNASVRNLCK